MSTFVPGSMYSSIPISNGAATLSNTIVSLSGGIGVTSTGTYLNGNTYSKNITPIIGNINIGYNTANGIGGSYIELVTGNVFYNNGSFTVKPTVSVLVDQYSNMTVANSVNATANVNVGNSVNVVANVNVGYELTSPIIASNNTIYAYTISSNTQVTSNITVTSGLVVQGALTGRTITDIYAALNAIITAAKTGSVTNIGLVNITGP
jgi:hypothetical protein